MPVHNNTSFITHCELKTVFNREKMTGNIGFNKMSNISNILIVTEKNKKTKITLQLQRTH